MASVLATWACQVPTDVESTLDIGTVQGYFADDPAVDAPDTVSVGVAFTVRIQTYGNGCN